MFKKHLVCVLYLRYPSDIPQPAFAPSKANPRLPCFYVEPCGIGMCLIGLLTSCCRVQPLYSTSFLNLL